MNRLETYLFQALIFLIPANLALHLYHAGGYLHGRLADYLLPKIYLSDLFLLGIISLLLFTTSTFPRIKGLFKYLPLVLLATYLLARGLFTPLPLASIYFVIRLLIPTLFAYYLFRRRHQLLSLIPLPLSLSLIFQSIIGIVQFIRQSSIYGYLFLGETTLIAPGVATETYFGVLRIPPYGTTPHPNVLAGFLTIGLLSLLIIHSKVLPTRLQRVLTPVAIGLSLVALMLTVSLTGLFGLLLGLLALYTFQHTSERICRLLVMAIIFSALTLSPLLISLAYHSHHFPANASITARYELNRAALNMFSGQPLTGIGPNMFVYSLARTNLLPGQMTYTYQPAHHLPLLLLAEVGLIGLILVAWALKRTVFRPLSRSHPVLLVPLSVVLAISSLDHFFLTLQTGQLLTALALALPLMVPPAHH
jgi:hypothetical protein